MKHKHTKKNITKHHQTSPIRLIQKLILISWNSTKTSIQVKQLPLQLFQRLRVRAARPKLVHHLLCLNMSPKIFNGKQAYQTNRSCTAKSAWSTMINLHADLQMLTRLHSLVGNPGIIPKHARHLKVTIHIHDSKWYHRHRPIPVTSRKLCRLALQLFSTGHDLCPSLPCAQRKTAPYFQIHLNVEPSERCSIDSIAPYPPKKNKLEQSVTTTSDSSEILLVDFFGVYNLAILQSPQPTNRLQRTKAASVCCHAGSTWGMRGTCTLHRWTDHMKVICVALFEVWWRYDGDLMRDGDFLIFVEGFSEKAEV